MAMYQAVKTFAFRDRVVSKGDVVASDDPILEGRESLFRLVPPPPDVEQATAAPGERRARRQGI